MAILTNDIECHINYFLSLFRNPITGEVFEFAIYNDRADFDRADLRKILQDNTIITFNGLNYDMAINTLCLCGASNLEMKKASDDIIRSGLMPWTFERKYNVKIITVDHIDLIQVAFGTASLKVYGARLGSKLLQELPIHHDNFIMPDQVDIIDQYCINDNIVTADLYNELKKDITLRENMSTEYGIDLRSKSNAQIAEQVIKSEYIKLTGVKLPKAKAEKSYEYQYQSYVFFETVSLNNLLSTCLSVDFNISKNGKPVLPKELNKLIKVGKKSYKMGIGGLHSVDSPGSYYSDENYKIYDIDVASYYPFIILNSGFEPKHIGAMFTKIYRDIVERRLTAKKAGNKTTADSLKIVINGLFGKFGNRYSAVYSPELLFNTTITGQLCLFMLIEQFAKHDIDVISANTDGITIRVHNEKELLLKELVTWWENVTNFEMEYTEYKSIHHRDVNNYIAVYQLGGFKGKGIFASDGIRKNPANAIIRDACINYILSGTPPEETIRKSKDVTQFLTVKKVTGGAHKDGVPLGATVRWYRSLATETAINYIKNDNQVGGSEDGMPLMNLPDTKELPFDIDIKWYIDKAVEQLKELKVIDYEN